MCYVYVRFIIECVYTYKLYVCINMVDVLERVLEVVVVMSVLFAHFEMQRGGSQHLWG